MERALSVSLNGKVANFYTTFASPREAMSLSFKGSFNLFRARGCFCRMASSSTAAWSATWSAAWDWTAQQTGCSKPWWTELALMSR